MEVNIEAILLNPRTAGATTSWKSQEGILPQSLQREHGLIDINLDFRY
jgi:hypothetical protein